MSCRNQDLNAICVYYYWVSLLLIVRDETKYVYAFGLERRHTSVPIAIHHIYQKPCVHMLALVIFLIYNSSLPTLRIKKFASYHPQSI